MDPRRRERVPDRTARHLVTLRIPCMRVDQTVQHRRWTP
jgi:hypothetical protein